MRTHLLRRHAVAMGAALVFASLASLTLWAWSSTSRAVRRDAEVHFNFEVSQASFALEQRLRAYQQVLHGGAALFAASPGVTREQWRNYVRELKLGESFPAIQAIAFAQRVHAEELDAHLLTVRSNGHPGYEVAPAGQRDLYAPVVYIEPFDERNRKIFGLDFLVRPASREVLERATETALPALSGAFELRASLGAARLGFMMCMPALSAGTASVGAVSTAPLDGFICSLLPVQELMHGLLGPEDVSVAVGLQVYDGAAAVPDALIYQNTPWAAGRAPPAFASQQAFEFLGRAWVLRFSSTPALEGSIDTQKPRLVLFGGLLVSALLSAVFWALATNRRRARALATANTGLEREVDERTRLGTQLREITDAMPALIAYLDANGRFQFHNKAYESYFDLDGERIDGHSIREVLGNDVHEELAGGIAEVLAGMPVRYERSHARADGSRMDLAGHLFPRYDDSAGMGAVIGFYSLETDITAMKRVNRMKSEFISMVSHELRTPLTSIRGSLGLVAGGVAGALPAPAKSLVEIAKNNCERLIRLINDLLDTEKLESGKMRFDLKVLDLRPLVEQALAHNEGFAAQHGVTLKLIACEGTLSAQADGDRLAQVLANLLSNAIKFSPKGMPVEIALQRAGDRIRIEVRDRGPGIPDEFRGRIFQKFSQADSSDTRAKGGTGLGLNISKQIVERLGGSLGFTSEAGVGTTFFFELPAWDEPTSAAQAIAPAPDTATARPRVLVCEDDRDIARLIARMLEHAGIDADLAFSAAETRARLATTKYAALTVDINLPDEDGISMIRSLRAEAGTRDLPIIVVSASADGGRVHLNSDVSSVAGWLQKPIDENRLVASIRAAIGGYAGARPRVLHVEDDPDIRHIAAAIAHDLAVFEFAGTLKEARALLRERAFDLVLLDLDLPDGSGWGLLPDLARQEPRPPVVVFSASEMPDVVDGQAQAFLVKAQTSNEEFLATLQRLLAPRRAPATLEPIR